jgi:hypothetical protein
MNDNTQPRWNVKITYRHEDRPRTTLMNIEELFELQDIIERGPSFYSIINIEVMPNERCPKVTVEEAMRK